MLTDQEISNLNLLIKGNRAPENGMEIHFLRCLKGDSSPCTKKEKEWHQYWLQNIKANPKNADPKSELDNFFTIFFLGDQLKGGVKRDWSFGSKWILDFFFDSVRLGIEIECGEYQEVKQMLNSVEKELALELHGITIARFTKEEVFGDRRDLLKKFNRFWRQAEVTTKRYKAEAITKQQQIETKQRQAETKQRQTEPTVYEQDEIRKKDKLNRAIRFIKKLDKLEQSRKMSGRVTDTGYAGGWTSLKQGERKVGDTTTKQYINEGIAGTRDENKKMRGQLWGDMRNRGKGH